MRDSKWKSMGSPLENFYEFLSGYLETIFRDLRKGVSRCGWEWIECACMSLLCDSLNSLSGIMWHQRTVLEPYSCSEGSSFKITMHSLGNLTNCQMPIHILLLSLCMCVKSHITALHPFTHEIQKHLPLKRKHCKFFSNADNKEVSKRKSWNSSKCAELDGMSFSFWS